MKITQTYVRSLVAFLPFLLLVSVQAAVPAGNTAPDNSAEWLDQDKFGMFIHWGLYSELARGEWVMNREKIPVAEYSELAETFNPVKFNADEWVAVAKNAGMKYITITSKHHDGFCMFDTAVDDYNIVDGTPFKRDILKELKTACDKAGIKLGFYYSQAQDWYHPGGSGKKWDAAQRTGDFQTYVDTVSIPQIKELLAYEPTHIWFDTPHSMTPEIGREIVNVIRAIKPDTLLNSRLMYHGNQVEGLKPAQLDELTDIGVDFLSYRDRTIPSDSPWEYWETCMTLNNSWGYNAGDNNWKTPKQVVMQLVEVVSKGGTFLLNIGPTAEGVIPQPAVACLAQVGNWLKVNGEAIYGAEKGGLAGEGVDVKISAAKQAKLEKEALATGAGKAKKKRGEKEYRWLATSRPAEKGAPAKIYLHIFEWPDGKFEVKGIAGRVSKAYLLSNKTKPLMFSRKDGTVSIDLPESAPDPIASVVCLELN
jgi:alpha-L-fucosidase